MSGAGDAERGEMTFSKELLASVCTAEAYIYPCFGLNPLHALALAILPGSGSQDSLEPPFCGQWSKPTWGALMQHLSTLVFFFLVAMSFASLHKLCHTER